MADRKKEDSTGIIGFSNVTDKQPYIKYTLQKTKKIKNKCLIQIYTCLIQIYTNQKNSFFYRNIFTISANL